MAEAAKQLNDVIDAKQLGSTLGLQQHAAIERYLQRERIPYFPGRNGPWTTLTLINDAGRAKLGISKPPEPEQDDEDYL